MSEPVLEVRDLKKHFPVRTGLLQRAGGTVFAVDGVSFSINEGDTLALVGESGCGKSTVGRTVLRLIEPTAGEIRVGGHDITTLSKAELRPYRRQMQIIFQDPFSSLDPRMSAGEIVAEPMRVHRTAQGGEVKKRVAELFERVGLRKAQMSNFPHQFSGGQRQRIGIARALALQPKLIVGDEPVSALDVSIQAQVLNLMMDLQREMGLAYLFISHNLAVVEHLSHHIAVMYLGRIVELTDKRTLFTKALHPYTESLLLAVPVFAQLHTYRENYYPGQVAQSEGGFPFTRALRDFLPKDSVIVVAGGDWSAIIPYYTQRKALMIRNGLENDATYLDRAFADLADETVGALVLVDAQSGNRALVERTAAAFGTDRQPSFSSDRAEIYCNLLYRDRLKEDLRNAGNYDGLKNETSAPAPAATTQPFRISSGLARTSFPGISPAPIRAHFEFGLGYIWIEERKVIFAHPHTNLWIPAPSQTKQITWDFGIVSGAYEGKEGKTDGVEFTLMGIRPGGEYRVVFRRILEPATQAADRGTQHEVISYETVPGEILEFSTSPGQGRSFDWAYWAKIEVK